MQWPPSTPMSDAIRPLLLDPLDVVGRAGELERGRVLRDQAIDDVDLVERGADGVRALALDGHVDGPELAANAAVPQPGDIGHQIAAAAA